ncbi:hypothetical protein BU25DRAFT_144424 [Macroventuria anomochaeta]|uniref:Uncharacterized protein n=1 Tax=Macroventuria anomochaeta TaxID=301207 RepID=A0ACB6SDZ6_9PLEO|nr:uncharacterized protein BU25DRAFT_144424 [Macroventuria anomochaeta]KAF2632223.1 hypothetical protein BU25DRAFT_144424 [Macroventuria anomochaeta]
MGDRRRKYDSIEAADHSLDEVQVNCIVAVTSHGAPARAARGIGVACIGMRSHNASSNLSSDQRSVCVAAVHSRLSLDRSVRAFVICSRLLCQRYGGLLLPRDVVRLSSAAAAQHHNAIVRTACCITVIMDLSAKWTSQASHGDFTKTILHSFRLSLLLLMFQRLQKWLRLSVSA